MSDPEHHHVQGSEHPHDFRADSKKRLWVGLALISSYMAAEVAGGIWANSLTLLADAGHMVTDATAIGLALLAMWIAGRPASIGRTFGLHRTEVLAALANALSLWLIAAWIFFEAYRRFADTPEVHGPVMLAVGVGGMLVNLAAAWVLSRSTGDSLNVEGAFLHVLADLMGSIAVIGASILIIATGWTMADPVFGVVLGLLILFSSARLLWKVVHVLMEGTPSHLDLHRLCRRMEQLEGVTGVHDIHAWSITTGYEAFSAHVTAEPAVLDRPNHILDHLRNIASEEFGIAHVTIQLEDSQDGCAEDHHIDHPPEANEPAGAPRAVS